MASALHFETSFWSQKQPHSTLPDFQSGLQILHQKLQQSKVENEEVITFFKDRISIEESYGNKLIDQSKIPSKNSGFGRDEGAGLRSCFENFKVASSQFGTHHKETAATMTDSALKPLQTFNEDYKNMVATSRQQLDSNLKQFDGLYKDAERAKSLYNRRCREADQAEEQAVQQASLEAPPLQPPTSPTEQSQPPAEPAPPVPPKDIITVRLGSQVLTPAEFDTLIQQMRKEIPVKDHRVPILGTYKSTSTGEDIARWLQHNLAQCKDSPAMADIVGQQLIQPHGVLRLIAQRGNKFLPSATSYYQWRIRDPEEEAGSVGSNPTTSALGGIFEKLGGGIAVGNGGVNGGAGAGGSPVVPGEEPYKKARMDAERADEAYRSAVKRVDRMRTVIEEALFTHFAEMEKVELRRLDTLKQVFSAFASCLSASLPGDKAIVDQMRLFLESLKPEQDIQYIVQQYCTASFSPKAMLYENYYHGIAHDQIFGVPLEELGKQTENGVPQFVTYALEAITQGANEMSLEEKRKLWSTPLGLESVHTARADINIASSRITVDLLKQYEPGLLVAVLRLFLLELPEPLLTFEFYDPAQALYNSNSKIMCGYDILTASFFFFFLIGEQDESMRIFPLSHLISSLPGSHFNTLDALLTHLDTFIRQFSKAPLEEEEIFKISQILGPIILRSRVETLTTLTSRVPRHLAHDLIKYHKDIFSEVTYRAHAESEKRRQTRLVALRTTEQTEAETKKRGLMSFIRPSEETKWGVNSVMGVFQRNGNGSGGGSGSGGSGSGGGTSTSPPVPSPSDSRSFTPPTSMHFGSVITQESPPSSPTLPPKADPPPPSSSSPPSQVMFDVADHISDKPASIKETDKKEVVEAPPPHQPKEESQPEGELDPFFADD
ncbi:hypothetical protein PHYBLDRAFT_189378 [Phycomyces blakesleeanus NRRL 1555(-)]|uniref:Rho-GAP domain-containing protein n=1 Tax=Phycomyces blakesleeanus (strain ATCC 8743b / DSM 1359 / FGSC 10004 / NBRC 33097 / NRRL 1555) TaxID=763407 RepID=A0A162T432_PHYB8|nr:hypothetical protein PHYBLDRAFT_189378 [Phycomyces blakesleeanus NRRL 1555(-)]OAD66122.1 hypothetical protein PHYBLDRAFT_189378 [Phycomyces blakesleeanus NRRL 1555(-)]|eukprot:XP_018284162.1 hypothetical protein PHYBLDRAFT_189378 [Phycomyces blakesleeanus NRRL 1555(-)]